VPHPGQDKCGQVQKGHKGHHTSAVQVRNGNTIFEKFLVGVASKYREERKEE